MSVIALAYVLRHSEAKLGARLTLIALADFAQDDGDKAFPSIETLCRHTRLSRSAVKASIKRLLEDGDLEERGATRSGTKIYRVVMGGRIPTGGQNPAVGGSDSGAGGSASDPNPSREPSEKNTSSGGGRARPVLTPDQEPVGFAEWLGYHVVKAKELFGLELSVPRAATSYRTTLAHTFAALAGEGYSLEDLKHASIGVLADDFMRDGGHVKPENVLRKQKIGGRIDAGRRYLETAGGGGKYRAFDD